MTMPQIESDVGGVKKPKTKKGSKRTGKKAGHKDDPTSQPKSKSDKKRSAGSGKKKGKKSSDRVKGAKNKTKSSRESNDQLLKIHATANPQSFAFNPISKKKKQFSEFWFANQSLDGKGIYWSAHSSMKEITVLVYPDCGILKEDKKDDIVIAYATNDQHQESDEDKTARIVITYTEAPTAAEHFDEEDFKSRKTMSRKETVIVTITTNADLLEKNRLERMADQDENSEREEEDYTRVTLEPLAVLFKPPFRYAKKDKFILNNKSNRNVMWHIKSTNNSVLKFDPSHGLLSADSVQTVSVHLLPFYQPEDAEDRSHRTTIEFIYLTAGKGKQHQKYVHETMRESPVTHRRHTHMIIMGTLYQTAREDLI